MKKLISSLFLLALVSNSALADTPDDEAAALVKRFGGQLKPALLEAMSTGGPVHAVAVCAETAPSISQALSEESGWEITRVSLKARNPNAAPDAFERQALEDFNLRRAAGEDVRQLKHSAMVDGQFRYLQAQLTEGLCLSCHGTQIAPEVMEMIRSRYPDDQATGYHLGEVRGAISLTRTITPNR